MVAILSHIPEQAVFEPAAITAMSQAFEDACSALHVFASDQRGREAIATRIIDLARCGVLDAQGLRKRVLREAQAAA